MKEGFITIHVDHIAIDRKEWTRLEEKYTMKCAK